MAIWAKRWAQVFVEKYYPPEAKARTLKMVNQLEAALHQDITELPWMSEVTKKQALVKLAAIQNKIGYPAKWRDYTALKIEPATRWETLCAQMRLKSIANWPRSASPWTSRNGR